MIYLYTLEPLPKRFQISELERYFGQPVKIKSYSSGLFLFRFCWDQVLQRDAYLVMFSSAGRLLSKFQCLPNVKKIFFFTNYIDSQILSRRFISDYSYAFCKSSSCKSMLRAIAESGEIITQAPAIRDLGLHNKNAKIPGEMKCVLVSQITENIIVGRSWNKQSETALINHTSLVQSLAELLNRGLIDSVHVLLRPQPNEEWAKKKLSFP